jgi:hypothetical protein
MREKGVQENILEGGNYMKSKIALLLIFVMVFSLAACGGQSESGDTDRNQVIREIEPPVLQTGNEATAIALKQYIYARLLTEHLATEGFAQLSETERKGMMDELVAAWEAAAEFTASAEKLTEQAVMELENTASLSIPGKMPFSFLAVAYAADEAKDFDQKAWAEKLTKQYDALKGAKRYNQLAKQLGVDARTAYEQMTLAQEIIHKGAMADADWNNKVVNILQATKTTSKVAVFGLSLVATGGASVSVLEGAGFIASGIECVIEVADTSSTIILGEKNKVSVGFNELKKVTAPVTSVIGLLNFDVANLKERTKGTGDALIYISDSVLDLVFENKVLGMEISTSKDGKVAINGQTIDVTGMGTEAVKSALEEAGFPLPDAPMEVLELIRNAWDPDIEVMRAQMGALTAGLTEEVSEEPPVLVVGSIFGSYSYTMTYQDGEVDTGTCTIEDNGDGTIAWISDDMDITTLYYEEGSRRIYYSGDGLNLEILFTSGLGGVKGTGRMYGTFWDSPIDVSIDMTKQ